MHLTAMAWSPAVLLVMSLRSIRCEFRSFRVYISAAVAKVSVLERRRESCASDP